MSRLFRVLRYTPVKTVSRSMFRLLLYVSRVETNTENFMRFHLPARSSPYIVTACAKIFSFRVSEHKIAAFYFSDIHIYCSFRIFEKSMNEQHKRWDFPQARELFGLCRMAIDGNIQNMQG